MIKNVQMKILFTYSLIRLFFIRILFKQRIKRNVINSQIFDIGNEIRTNNLNIKALLILIISRSRRTQNKSYEIDIMDQVEKLISIKSWIKLARYTI